MPIEAEIHRLYPDTYYTHARRPDDGGEGDDGHGDAPGRSGGTAPASDSTSASSSPGAWLRDAVLAGALGYRHLAGSPAQARLGRWLALLAPVRRRAEQSVRGLTYRAGGRLLDVGCGGGAFLVWARRLGWEVVGVDPDPGAVRAARGHGLEVHVGTLDEVELGAARFDAIVLNHVIEHVSDPVGTLAASRRLLRADGCIVVVTPNVHSLGHRLFGRHWLHLDPPRHLYLFSPESLRRCAVRAGLRVERLETRTHEAVRSWRASRDIARRGRWSPREADPGPIDRTVGHAFRAIEAAANVVWPCGEEVWLTASDGR